MRKSLKAAVYALCLLLSYLGASANWGGGADGCIGSGSFQALGAQQVVMDQEKLEIGLYRDRAKVRVEYVLINTGEALTVTAGFPCAVYNTNEGQLEEIEDYRISVDGRTITYAKKAGTETKGFWLPKEFTAYLEEGVIFDSEPEMTWLISQVPFGKGAQRKVAIEYVSLYDCSAGGVSNDTVFSVDTFYYLLSTGRTWKGPIHAGEVIIKAVTVDPNTITVLPANRFKRVGNEYRWTFSNLEPNAADDIRIALDDEVAVYAIYETDEACWYSAYGDLYYLDSHRYSIQSSSELKGPYSYSATNVCDLNAKTAWVEGAPGDGIGESLTIILDRPAKGIQLGIIPGYAKSKEIYFANNRVAEFKIIINGSLTMTRRLWDDWTRHGPWSPKAYQFIDLGGDVEVKTVKLVINEVYKGSKYQDTAISEILLRQKLAKKPAIQGAR